MLLAPLAMLAASHSGFLLAPGEASPCLTAVFAEATHDPELAAIRALLNATFGIAVPQAIYVQRSPDERSRFDPETASVLLSDWSCERELVNVLTHESSHLALFAYTHGASAEPPFRFLDEGFANLMGARADGAYDAYREHALRAAAVANAREPLAFAAVQDWYGEAGYSQRPGSYEVGSSFDLLLAETRSPAALFAVFADLGRTHDLAATLENVLHLTPGDAERAWRSFLAATPVPPPPSVVGMAPADGDHAVPCSLPELTVTFDQPMDTHVVCVMTPGTAAGVSYTDAHWLDALTLALKVDPRLVPGVQYELSLGVEGQCRMLSDVELPLPVTPWRFSCKD